ncbi:MAG TPA: zinc ribbon domain-containing protein [Blastocatellia bacterium]|nr:zinc ribbon domain-containing protein [Blastocatellia bacterium]
MQYCPNCGTDIEEGKKFCRMCGMPVQMTTEEASTWRLPPNTAPAPDQPNPTMPMKPNTGEASAGQTGPAYIPPGNYYPVVQPPPYPFPPRTEPGQISLVRWLSEGWSIYKQNWALMSVASAIGMFLSFCTLGILAGPMLMGLYRMAFKTMRGDRPDINDLFNWEGRFLHAFLAFLITAAISSGLTGAGNQEPFFVLISFLVWPLLTVMLGMTMPMILDRKVDIIAAINQVGRAVFSRDAFMWWVVGLVFATIIPLGMLGCFIGIFLTIPWIVSSAAVAYRDMFGYDDPNRTLH